MIAVSEIDAERMKTMFGVKGVTSVPTGVDLEYFAAPGTTPHVADMIFSGSMDWLPNVDAVEHFVREVLPLIREQLPSATFTIAGRSPDARVLKAVQGFTGVSVTGKVDDMRPYLWGSRISVVPIRIGGGTRLKITSAWLPAFLWFQQKWARRDFATRTAPISPSPTILTALRLPVFAC